MDFIRKILGSPLKDFEQGKELELPAGTDKKDIQISPALALGGTVVVFAKTGNIRGIRFGRKDSFGARRVQGSLGYSVEDVQ